MKNKIFCPAPFLHQYVNVNNHGHKLCCMSKEIKKMDSTLTVQQNMENFWVSDELKQIRQDFVDNKWPGACEWYCGKYEKQGVYEESYRHNFIDRYKDIDIEQYDLNVETGNKTHKPIDLDFRPGNTCNLKCRSCTGIWSNTIQKEVIANPELQGTYYDTGRNYSQLDTSTIDLSNIQSLKMSGGETLVDPNVYTFLNKAVEDGYAKNIELHLLTNGTYMPKRIISVLEQFRSLVINVSIDAVGSLEEYLRTGTVWPEQKQVFETVLSLPNLKKCGINSVIQITGIFGLQDLIDFAYDSKYTSNKKYRGVSFLPIVDPEFLSIGLMTDAHKQKIMRTVEHNIDNVKFDKFESQIKPVVSEVHRVFNDRSKLLQQGQQHISHLDKIRNTNILELQPELAEYYE